LHTFIKNREDCDNIQELENILNKKHVVRGS